MYSDDLDKDNWSIGVLDIDLKTALSNMQPKEFAYLQIVPPSWMLQDDALLSKSIIYPPYIIKARLFGVLSFKPIAICFMMSMLALAPLWLFTTQWDKHH